MNEPEIERREREIAHRRSRLVDSLATARVTLREASRGRLLGAWTVPLLAAGLGLVAAMGIRRYLDTVPRMLEDDPLAGAGNITAPCLLVRGEWDAIIPETAVRRLASTLTAGLITTIPGAAHAVQFNSPERFVNILTGFLTGSSEPEPRSRSLPDR